MRLQPRANLYKNYDILNKSMKKLVGGIVVKEVRKRDGHILQFSPEKLEGSVLKALSAVKSIKAPEKLSEKIVQQVAAYLERHFSSIIPTTEDLEDVIIEVLHKNKLKEAAIAFLNFRKKKEVKEFKNYLGVRDDIGLTKNAIVVMSKRYLLRNEQGKIVETPRRLFQRVAKAIASVDNSFKLGSALKAEQNFFELLSKLEFIPNTPCLMNAGTMIGQLSACFVIPVEDSLPSIFEAVKSMAVIQQSGGGTGFSFSRLRPRGDIVMSTKGVASGPITFMEVFDKTTDIIKQGGKRRGANMGILRCDHPDVFDFIAAKTDESRFRNFNISIAATDEFMQAVKKDKEYNLVNPRTKRPVKRVKAREVFDKLCENAWKTGDPGMIFIDTINRANPTPALGNIESTNPCGEVPLLPFESCNLGSINLAKFVKQKKVDWDRLKWAVREGVHFLDNVVDINKYPLPQIEQVTKGNRKLGLGVMGFAEMLIKLGIPYDSKEAIAMAEKIMKFIKEESHKKSHELALQRGSFPNFEQSMMSEKNKAKTEFKWGKWNAFRNATVTTIAPTGTISIIAGASSGIEPLFAVSYAREVLEGTKLLEVNQLFKETAQEEGFYSKELMAKIARTGSVQNFKDVPAAVRRLFVTALDIKPEWHLKIQAAFQKYTDNAVSKTINLPEKATIEDVKKIYLMAYDLGCKGITIYRYGCKSEQVLYIEKEQVRAKQEFAGGCVGAVCEY